MAGDAWQRMPLGEFVTLQRGHDLPDERRRPGHVPILGSFGVTGWHDEAKAPGPGVTVGRSGASFGVVSYSPVNYWPLNTALYVKDFHGNDRRFAYYFLKQFDFRGYNSGSAQPSLNRNFVHPVLVDVPPLSEQRAIAHILGTLDDKIELNRRMGETLEETARALFQSWFVDLDPVRANCEGRDPGLPKSLTDLFPDSFEESELGEMPKGWRVGCFGEVVEQLHDQENPLSSPDALFHHFSIPAFDEGRSPKPEFGGSIKSVKSRVPAGTILLSKLNPEIERVWMIDVRRGERAVCSTEFLVLSAASPFTRSYVYCLARSPLFRQQIEGLVTGTSKSHQRAQVDSILKLAVVVPPSSIVGAFDHYADSLLVRTLECRRESRTLAALRNTLLPQLFSGDTRIAGIERAIAGDEHDQRSTPACQCR
jgi:type I restriction enzyme, S subunit